MAENTETEADISSSEPTETGEKPVDATPTEKPEEAAQGPEEKPEEKPEEHPDEKPEEKPEEKPDEGKPPPDKEPEKEEPTLEPASSKTVFDVVADKFKDLYNDPYKMKVIACMIIFLLALEMARELKNISIPLFLYKPFRKLQDIYQCLSRILCN